MIVTQNETARSREPELNAPSPARRPLRTCTVAYTFYERDSRVMRYDEALAARGDTVDVIALRAPGQPAASRENGVNISRIQSRSVTERSSVSYLLRILLFFFRALALLTWRQLRFRYDLVHVHSVPEFLVFIAWLPKLMGARVILDIHDLLPELYADKFGIGERSFLFKLLRLEERVSISFSDHVITANDLWHETLLRRGVRAHKATSLVNFPDRAVFRPQGKTRADGKFIIVYPGSLNSHQGLDIAIHAFAKVRPAAPNAEFHIYGVGPALPSLRLLVRELCLEESVRFEGQVSLREIVPIIEDADLGIVPKRKDSFGNEAFSTKILEFMSLGVPVVVSDTRIDSYYFDNSTVKFFRSGDVDHLAACLLEMMNNPSEREELRRAGFRYVEGNCWDVKKAIYYDVVDHLVGVSS